MGSGGTPSGRTSLSLGSGAFQVYDESISDRLSDLLSHYFDHPRMYWIAQDWRGIQFFILDKLTQHKPETMVYIHDPARGIAEELLPYGLLLLRIADGTILNGCALDQFAFWLERAGLSSLDVGQCITPRVFVFLGGNEEDYDTDPRSALPYVYASLKMAAKLRDSGLKDGDILTQGHSHPGILQRSQLIWMNPHSRTLAGPSRVESPQHGHSVKSPHTPPKTILSICI